MFAQYAAKLMADAAEATRPAVLLSKITCAFPGHTPEAPRYVAVSETSLEIKNGEFVAPVKLSQGVTAWPVDAVLL